MKEKSCYKMSETTPLMAAGSHTGFRVTVWANKKIDNAKCLNCFEKYGCTIFVYNLRTFFNRSIQRPALDEVYQTLKVHHRITQDQVSPKLIFQDAMLS